MNNLSQVKMPDNSNYHFKDTEATETLNNLNASNLSYDNTGMPIEDENVQDALDTISSNLQPNLIVQIDSGSSITITNGTTIITGTSIGGQFSTKIPKLGTWTIIVTLNGRTVQKTISVVSLGKTYTVSLEYFSATLTITTAAGATVYISGADELEEIATGGTVAFTLSSSGSYSAVAKIGNVYSESISFNATTDGQSINKSLNFIVLNLTAPEDSEVEITDGDTRIEATGTGSSEVFYLPNTGVWTATAELDGEETSETITVNSFTTYAVELAFVHIYGVEWDGSSSTVLSRTDESALFVDPDPYVADGSHPGSSPFDNLMPWKGMRRVTLDGNELVEIPKFWYKITKTGSTMTFQIANGPVEGFSVSPAHMDRGDGAGERDYVYVGRYHCSSTDYKSTSGSSPKVSITRSTARTSIHNLGSDYWLSDFAMFWTIRMLYLVEFADWDSQKVIGYGCGNGSSVVTMGYTDSMPYHTGTMASSRTTYAASTQYRYIEGIWDNVFDWCDGIRFSSSKIYTYLNPSTYSDSSGGTNTGTRLILRGCISAFGIPSATDYEWALYPSSVVSDSSYSTYVADYCGYRSSGVVLCVGGYYGQSRYYGMFFLNGYYGSSSSDGSIGARLQYLPPNS